MTATIFDIQRNSYVDGPGIRTTVFFKGCNLRCKWCHNPESQSPRPQLLFYKNKCTGCGKCKSVCKYSLSDCDFCGDCTIFCPTDAREVCGKSYTPEQVLAEIVKDKPYYDASGGGVTFSGGECMLQIDFLEEILRLCKQNGIHTAVDTAGCVSKEHFDKILPYTDLFLYDLKCLSEQLHLEATGQSNKLIISNLDYLCQNTSIDIILRIPVVPGVNATDEEMSKMAEYANKLRLKAVELLPYHQMGEHKYEPSGVEFFAFEVPSQESMNRYKAMFN